MRREKENRLRWIPVRAGQRPARISRSLMLFEWFEPDHMRVILSRRYCRSMRATGHCPVPLECFFLPQARMQTEVMF